MFTGIVVERGEVRRARLRGGTLELDVSCPRIARELSRGDSVAVNGACLTATDVGRRHFGAEVTEETLARTTLGSLAKGDTVNLELAARLSDRLGGHLVQGHVDGVAVVRRAETHDGTTRLWLQADEGHLRYVVAKGSVALDGVSLTVVDVGTETFQVALIPHTLTTTTLGNVGVGTSLNVEVDVIAKYVERLARAELKRER